MEPDIIAPPDLSARPLQSCNEFELTSSPQVVFQAWTRQLDRWLAAPGTVLMTPAANTAFFFETHHGPERHQYYGRILRLVPDSLLQLAWLSTGTKRVETVITLEISPHGAGAKVRLTHAGFPDQESRNAHQEVWPSIVKVIDDVFSNSP